VEIVYHRTLRSSKYYIPFYKFHVELDASTFKDMAEGLKIYGIYYVLAVDPSYVEVQGGYNMYAVFNWYDLNKDVAVKLLQEGLSIEKFEDHVTSVSAKLKSAGLLIDNQTNELLSLVKK
jgi:Uma2 family endonuclease